jgi:uncharacterized membrane protein YtjA (UPF0391 family)
MAYRSLDAERIAHTIDALCRRVESRFPDSGLAGVVRDLDEIARRTAETTAWIARPILPLRVGVALLVILILAGIAATAVSLRPALGPLPLPELIQTLEAGVNDVVFVAAAIFFLVTVETRIKRRRALAAIQELRSIAHVIDMHQLTKDPELVLERAPHTGVLPPRRMSSFELSRYLDYCSEALSLTGKVAALYIQGFDDAVALQAVNEVEDLTTALSRKVWQKLMVVYAMGPKG